MTDRKTKWNTDEKVRIVLQALDPRTGMVELCRQHNLAPKTAYGWKERFLEGGRGSLEGSDAATRARSHKKGVVSLKRIRGST